MIILVDRGDLDEARLVAHSILEQEDLLLAQHHYECACYLGSLARSHALLGNVDKARLLTEELVKNFDLNEADQSERLRWLKTEQAVELAFAELAKNPNWNGFDEIAAEYLLNQNILAHPRVQEYYVNEGKWIDYLAARVPAYSKLVRTAAE